MATRETENEAGGMSGFFKGLLVSVGGDGGKKDLVGSDPPWQAACPFLSCSRLAGMSGLSGALAGGIIIAGLRRRLQAIVYVRAPIGEGFDFGRVRARFLGEREEAGFSRARGISFAGPRATSFAGSSRFNMRCRVPFARM